MLYLPVGPPGCGKSTLCQWTLDQKMITKDAVICPDDIRVWMTGDRSRQDQNASVFRIVNTVLGCRLQQGLDVWLDATNLKFKRHHYMSMNLVTTILFDVPKDELFERNTTREFPVPDDVLTRMIDSTELWKSNNSDFVTPEEFMSGSYER